MKPLKVDVVSDVMCPWCLIGKKRLEKALASTEIPVEVRWRPYQLDPTLPPEGRDRREYLERKFGGPERARAIYERIEQAGRGEGIDFAFDRIAISPNTLDAHRVIRWAASAGDGVQGRLVDRLFELFFLEGAHIGDRDVLADAAAEAGMDRAIVRDLLESDRDVEAVKGEIAQAQAMGVTGVPCFVIDNLYAVMGAEPAEHLVQAFEQAAKEATA